MRRKRAFTLIELLIVVAIIAILAGISVPNFLEAQVRSKVARVQCDMSAVKAALRAYGAQYETYPPNRPAIRKALRKIRTEGLPAPAVEAQGMGGSRWPFLEKSGSDLARLTTPNAWLARALPVDPFYSSAKGGSYWDRPAPEPFVYINRYDVFHENGATSATMAGQGFMLLSYGPDSALTLPDPLSEQSIAYDPTNGTTSAGDLTMTGW